jgi:hypothetical protein
MLNILVHNLKLNLTPIHRPSPVPIFSVRPQLPSQAYLHLSLLHYVLW